MIILSTKCNTKEIKSTNQKVELFTDQDLVVGWTSDYVAADVAIGDDMVILLMWWVTWIQRASVVDDVARLINFASNVFCASILFAEFPSCCCWRRGVTADL